MQTKNILVFPCGTEIAQEVHAALKYEKSVILHGASSVEDHGRMVFSRYTPNIPFVTHNDFDAQFEALIKTCKIDHVIPAHDDVLLYLAENRSKFSANILAPSSKVCGICRSKQATYEALAGEDFVPAFYAETLQITDFPVFLKPDIGQGSQGILLANNRDQLEEALRVNPGLLACEYLPGKEFTIDCYSNKDGELLFTGARERIRTKAGISVHSKTLGQDINQQKTIADIAKTIGNRLGMTGMWFFQVKESSTGALKLMEVAPRIAGTMALHRVQGVNFALLALFEADDKPVAIQTEPMDAEIERALINRYRLPLVYSVLYLDLDDTLIIHDTLNMTLMRLVYQCADRSIPVRLITRHFQDPIITLEKFKIHPGLFDDIIWITDRETAKSNYITEPDALFIDDSFKERRDVKEVTGIPTLGPESGEALLDWRR